MARRVAAVLVAVFAIVAAPASASFLDDQWDSMSGLDAADGANWLRVIATGTPPTTMYAGFENDGVFRSTNAGLSWSPFSDGLDTADAKTVRAIFSGNGGIYAGTAQGLFKLGGSTWEPVAQGAEADPSHPTKLNESIESVLTPTGGPILAGTATAGVWRSTDGGATWQPPAPGNGMPTNASVWSMTALAPPLILAGTDYGVFRSIDLGSTWTPVDDGIPAGTTVLSVFADQHNPNIFYAATLGEGVFRSINAGQTWSPINGAGNRALGGQQKVQAMLQFSGANETRLYAGTWNGMYAGTTSNGALGGPVTWRHVTNGGLGSNTIFWALYNFTSTPGQILAGTQSDGGYGMQMTPPVNATAPTISGTQKVGHTLTADHGTWTGTPTIDFSYQWQRCTSASSCTDIPNATEQTRVLADADQGDELRVVVTASNDFPSFGLIKKASATTGAIGANDDPSLLPGANQSSTAEITGGGPDGAQAGYEMAAANWSFDPVAASTSFQWFDCSDASPSNADCSPIDGATEATYTPVDDDVGSHLAVKVTGTNGHGSTTLGFSDATNDVLAPGPHMLAAPAIEGVPYVGETLVGTVGEWAYPGTRYKRQWEQCEPDGTGCVFIQDANDAAYTVQPGDLGSTLRLDVTVDSNGDNQYPPPVDIETDPTAVIANAPPPGGAGSPPPPPPPAQSAPPAPAPSAPAAPQLQSLSLASSHLRRGRKLTVRYRLSGPASLSLAIERRSTGHRRGSSKTCHHGRPHHGQRRCTLYAKVGTITLRGLSGAGTARVASRTHGHELAAGTYRVVVTPVGPTGARGRSRTLRLVIR